MRTYPPTVHNERLHTDRPRHMSRYKWLQAGDETSVPYRYKTFLPTGFDRNCLAYFFGNGCYTISGVGGMTEKGHGLHVSYLYILQGVPMK